MEQKIIKLITEQGPLTGSEILDRVREMSFMLWRTCFLSDSLQLRILGTRYLRLDQRVDGYARLSPSILREFMTYSVVGIPEAEQAIDQRADLIIHHIQEVSKAKLALARAIVARFQSRLADRWPQEGRVCFIIAGDIVYAWPMMFLARRSARVSWSMGLTSIWWWLPTTMSPTIFSRSLIKRFTRKNTAPLSHRVSEKSSTMW